MKIEKAVSGTVSALPSQWAKWRRIAKKKGQRLSRWVSATLDESVNIQPPTLP